MSKTVKSILFYDNGNRLRFGLDVHVVGYNGKDSVNASLKVRNISFLIPPCFTPRKMSVIFSVNRNRYVLYLSIVIDGEVVSKVVEMES